MKTFFTNIPLSENNRCNLYINYNEYNGLLYNLSVITNFLNLIHNKLPEVKVNLIEVS
jgi:hypothetical protein